MRGHGFSEPGVIGDRHQKIGAFVGESPHQIRKNDLEADGDSKPGLPPVRSAFKVQQGWPRSRLKIADADDQFVQEKEYPLQRNVFAERNEVLLVVPSGDFAGGIQEIRAVQQVRSAVALTAECRTAEHERNLGVLRHPGHERSIVRLLFEHKRRGRFRPKDQVGLGTDGFGEPAVSFQGFRAIGLVPFVRLVNIGLNDSDCESVRRRHLQLIQPIEPGPEDRRNGDGERKPGPKRALRMFGQYPPDEQKH